MPLPLAAQLRDFYIAESSRLQSDFFSTSDGRTAALARSALVDSIARRLWKEFVAPSLEEPADFALVALGGFGRGWLFPFSDIDLLFLHAGTRTEQSYKDAIRRFSQELWDLRLKLSPATRKLSECEKFDPENAEFSISLLDCRYLAGDPHLFTRLHDSVIPKLVARESAALAARLSELTHARHAKFGATVFHLEPNVKDGPGGLRDCHVVTWLAQISAIARRESWPDPHTLLPASIRRQFDDALEFLTAVRCFLHLRHGRDDNSVAWEAQDDAASQKIGARLSSAAEAAAAATGHSTLPHEITDASDWMRLYFSHARAINRICAQFLEDVPTQRHSLYRQFQNLRSRLSNAEFSVVDDMVFLRQPEKLGDPEALLRAFRFLARHGLRLSSVTEHQIEQVLPSLSSAPPRGVGLWIILQEILLAPHAADALRALHSLRLLTLLIPEFAAVDSLVVRDYSHRYTVDEHTFVAIENLHALRQSQSKWDQRYAELLDEVEQPELLYLAILLHDVGKGSKSDNHVQASAALAEAALARLELDPPDREAVLFLIAHHLDMSAALRRDIFDPETIHAFAERVGSPENLKMLCLLTYADIKAVNPEALTPWKAENIWQLYIGTANHMLRSVDERLHVSTDDETLDHLRTLTPAAGNKLGDFLEGLPRRYLRTHPVEDVLAHLSMAAALPQDSVQLSLRRGRHSYELTLVTTDRPALFATMTGVLAAWGMNIVKAAAFSNQAGIVVDTFYFTDRFQTLELNLSEWERFKSSIHSVLVGKSDLTRMLQDRLRSEKTKKPKVKVETQISFDDECSAHSTLVEVIAQDQPGLLHRIASHFAQQNCNIEIAIIETEGQTAIDVFYLTSAASKLSPDQQSRLQKTLYTDLASK